MKYMGETWEKRVLACVSGAKVRIEGGCLQ